MSPWGGGGIGGTAGGGVPKGQGGGGFLNTMQVPRLSNFSRSIVAMVCHWAVQKEQKKSKSPLQREQDRDQTHSTPFN